jgi:hypothetical protein
MQGALIVSWRSPVRGRETQAAQQLRDNIAYIETLQKEGYVTAFRQFINLTTNRLGGVCVLEGDVDNLHEMQKDDNFREQQLCNQSLFEGYTTDMAIGGDEQSVEEALNQVTAVWQAAPAMAGGGKK